MSAPFEDSRTQAKEPGRVRGWLAQHVPFLVGITVALAMASLAILTWIVFGLGVVDKHVTTVSDSQRLARARSEQFFCVVGYLADDLNAIGQLVKAADDDDDAGIQMAKTLLAQATADLSRDKLAELCPLAVP